MMYRAKRSFVDPFTRRLYLCGKPYVLIDQAHAAYLERHGLIEHVDEAPAGHEPAGAHVSCAESEPKHVGGGWYELPDGRRVRGKEQALQVMRDGVVG